MTMPRWVARRIHVAVPILADQLHISIKIQEAGMNTQNQPLSDYELGEHQHQLITL